MRVKMCEKYQIEREEICNKIINILGLSEDGTFLLCELDSNIEKQIYRIENDMNSELLEIIYLYFDETPLTPSTNVISVGGV